MRCTACDQLGAIDTGLFVPWTNPFRPDWAKWVHRNCQRRKEALAVAARYVLACEKGHMDDFPWVEFAHHGNQVCETPVLSMYELSPGATAADVWVKCGCAQYKPRPLGIVFGPSGWTRLPKCRGRHPHLRSFTPDCDGRVRALLLGASNAWFGVTLSALSIPRTSEPLPQLVERLWGHLSDVDDEAVLGYAMKKTPELGVLAVHDRADVWAAVEARRNGEAEAGPGTLDLLPAEWAVLCDPANAPSSDDFLLSESEVPVGQEERISQVVLAQRLREVVAITGMTRIEAPVRNKDGQVLNLASLSRAKVDWVPACEVRGEGVVLRLDEVRLAGWEDYAAGRPRVEGMRLAHKAYLEVRGADTTADWPGARYVLLHTLSHLLIREIALECGYAAASIRERIYSRSGADTMAGVLFYTAAPDSEGTLGGLVALGKKDVLGRILSQALEHARLCSSDPLCAEHVPAV